MKTNTIPIITERVVHDDWKIFYYQEFEFLLFEKEQLVSEAYDLSKFASFLNSPKAFRREIIIKGFPLLCAVSLSEKSIYVATRRMSRELTMLEIYQNKMSKLDEESEHKILKLNDHLKKIADPSPVFFPSEIQWQTFLNDLPDFQKKDEWSDVNLLSNKYLEDLVEKTQSYKGSLFEKITDYGLGLTAQYDLIRVHVLKFIALLPSLDHDKRGSEVKKNLLEGLRRLIEDSKNNEDKNSSQAKPLPGFLFIAFFSLFKVTSLIPEKILAKVVRSTLKILAKRFIAGENIKSCETTLSQLKLSNRQATLDQLGELVLSSKEANEYFEKVLVLIHGLKEHFTKGEKNQAGILCAHISIKVSALGHDFKAHSFETTYQQVAPRLRRILQEAMREEVFVNIDAEHFEYRDLVFNIYQRVLLETPELQDYSQTGIVIQTYLRDASRHFLEVLELAKKRKIKMPIRLVKGAYWDAETIEARAHEFSAPQYLNKEESDLHFRQLCYLTLKHYDHLQLVIASHNLGDHSFVEALREKRFPDASVIEHQCLHMTYEALSHGLAKLGLPVRNYMPVGNLLIGMAYLVRRIMENSSQVGVLSLMRSHKKKDSLTPPEKIHHSKLLDGTLNLDSFVTDLNKNFAPVRPLRLFLIQDRTELEEAMGQLQKTIESNQDNFKASSDKKIFCSSRPDLIVGTIKEISPEQVVEEVEASYEALEKTKWGEKESLFFRVSCLLKAADLMLLKRSELSALIIYEAGKTMTEALADVDEAIDFINFYVREEIRIQHTEKNILNRGVIGVISPWNFPLAIPCGMSVAPLVAGNAVLLKPAEQTPLIAIEFHKIMLEAGIPESIFKLIPGEGSTVGAALVNHPKLAGVVFTGSKEVGLSIYQQMAGQIATHFRENHPMQKKVITEMGGKNAIIVTNNCEMDETLSGIIYSAFAHSGQKCSAASRLIVHRDVKDTLVKRLVQAISDIKVGSASDPSTFINPLITSYDQQRVKSIVSEARDEAIRCNGKIYIDRSFEKFPGFCVGPVLIELPPHQTKRKDSWAQREIFGPVIHIIEYTSLIEAVELFNSTEYALTGGIYSQSQDDIDFLLKFLHAGNLYVNRPNTGARVGIEPFGGFRLSGTGPKAGGSRYVREFHFLPENFPTNQDDSYEIADKSSDVLSAPKPSVISIPGRIKRIEAIRTTLENELSLIMGEKSPEKYRDHLLGFCDWVLKNLNAFLTEPHWNHQIPGQLSYNDKSLIKEAGLFVTFNQFPSVKQIESLISCLALGCGLSVACLTHESYATWLKITDMVRKIGYSSINFKCALVCPEDLRHLLSHSAYGLIYAEKFTQYHDSIYKNILEGDSLRCEMRQIMSEADGALDLDEGDILDKFILMRSFAINTMRHGAPLELL